MEHKIYGLVDPREPDEFRVVGFTKQPLSARIGNYTADTRFRVRRGHQLYPAARWVQGLLRKGIRPQIRLIHICDKRTWKLWETFFIAAYRLRGHRLLNSLDGGNGGHDSTRLHARCGNCSTLKKATAGGQRYCPKCRKAWNQKNQQALSRTPQRRAYIRNYRKTAKYLNASRIYQAKPEKRAYSADWHHANKLGITVALFRQQVSDGTLPDPRRRHRR